MKYLLLLNNAEAEWDTWRTLSEDEAGQARAEGMPRWNALFGWIG